jgi:hypothetical protein
LVGVHADSAEELIFSQAEAEFEGLTAWLTGCRNLKGAVPGEVKVGDFRVPFDLRRSSSWGHDAQGRMKSKRWSAIATIESARPQSARTMIDMVAAVADLVSFASMESSPWIRVEFWLPCEGDALWQLLEGRVALYRWRQPQAQGNLGTDAEMTFSGAHTDPVELARRWFDLRARKRTPLAALKGLLSDSAAYLEPRYMLAVAAAKSLAEDLESARRMHPDAYARLRDLAVNAAPAADREWLKSGFPRNQVGLQGKLHALVRALGTEVQSSLVPDPASWARDAADARHRIAHGRDVRQLDPGRLQALLEVMQAVLALTVMSRLGLSEEVQIGALQRNPRMRMAVGLSTVYWRSAADLDSSA